MIPPGYRGSPVTNVTLSAEMVSKISEQVTLLERLTPYPADLLNNPQALAQLDGSWRLVYSDASEITRLARLPLGFRLGPVFQRVAAAAGRLENQALVKHRLRLAAGSTRVLASLRPAPLGSLSRDGRENKEGNRVEVEFRRAIFTLDRLLVLPTFGRIRKVALPRGPSERAGVPATLDVTYLDASLRVGRGGDGSLFVLVREDNDPAGWLPEDAADVTVTASKTYDASTDLIAT